MHVLFLAPETQPYYREFVRGLREVGARVTGLGHTPRARVAPAVRPFLEDYVPVQSLFDPEQVLAAVRRLRHHGPIDRVETCDETLVVAAARLREKLGLPGISVETARLCRDKSAMKEFLRARGVPCAASRAASAAADVRAFAEEHGFPLILKPRAGFGSLNTHKVDSPRELDAALASLRLGDGRSIAVEEFVDGHEGFYDTIMLDGEPAHDFAAHYYPGCLEATVDRTVSPQIAVTNRVDGESYAELRRVGRRVNELLGLTRTATHMEWFFGPDGLRFSEIGARPAGERIWDLYRVANDFDVYAEWASAIVHGRRRGPASRRWAAGAIQIRPDRDGIHAGHEGLEAAYRSCGKWIYEAQIPPRGTPTDGVERGWIGNTWFRLRHPSYDRVRSMMTFLAKTVKARAVPAEARTARA